MLDRTAYQKYEDNMGEIVTCILIADEISDEEWGFWWDFYMNLACNLYR